MRWILTLTLCGCGALSGPDKATTTGAPTDPGAGLPSGAATGTGTGVAPGSPTGSGTGAATGTGTGAATGTGTGAGTGMATGTGTGTITGAPPPSCLQLLALNPTAPTGVYTIQPGPAAPVDVFCDMDTDGGGWTLVGSGVAALSDESAAWHVDLTTTDPLFSTTGIWDGLRAYVIANGGTSDIRFACTQVLGGPFQVDLSFYQTIWYAEITQGAEDLSCFNEGNGAGADPAPARRNNLTGTTLAAGDQWAAGYLEGEDACDAPDDFTVDFDDRGMDSNEADGTDWGDDDGFAKCGGGGGIGFFVFVRE